VQLIFRTESWLGWVEGVFEETSPAIK